MAGNLDTMFRTEDTIAAISTVPGAAPRGIVRLSGPDAISIAAHLFTSAEADITKLGGFRGLDGLVKLTSGNTAIAREARRAVDIELPARLYLFRRPRSYTRQDVVEFHIPGAPPAVRAILDSLIDAGARNAEPGEFTARAFLSGRIDLSQAEGVCDIINAANDAQLRAGLAALGGQIHRLCAETAAAIAEILATVEASIDLSEEQIELGRPEHLKETLNELAECMGSLADDAARMPDSTELPQVAIAGRPNAGKSSLLNALSGKDRAITSALAGTTRDVLSALLTLPARPGNSAAGSSTVRLLDAAGLTAPSDTLTAIAHNAAYNAVASADTILFVVDASAKARSGEMEKDLLLLREIRRANRLAPMLLLANKCDLTSKVDIERQIAEWKKTDDRNETPESQDLPVIPTSAVTGEGLDAVKARLREILHLSAGRSGQVLGLHDRQRRCLTEAAEASARAAELLGSAEEVVDVAELVAVELRDALAQLGAISGEIVTEDILGRIFSRFCVGK